MLTEDILNNWNGSPNGIAMKIRELNGSGYEGWTVKTYSEYGVALPISESEEISENFARARYYTRKIILDGHDERSALLLTTDNEDIMPQFAALCAELVNPGVDGEFRKEIEINPLSWWIQWKELLGNRNVDLRAYDVLGELWTLKYLAQHGVNAEWNGPNGSTYDIDCDDFYTEVKSTIVRKKREITLSNLFQLDPPEDKKLFLVFCQFEAAQSGVSINSLVNDLEALGYSAVGLNDKLEKLGLEKGKTARKRNYDVTAVTKYEINEDFPAIRKNSFVGGDLPKGITGITYTISLDGIQGENLKEDSE